MAIMKNRYSENSAASFGLTQCFNCGGVARADNMKCNGCGLPLHLRKPHAIERTFALTVAAMIMLVPANLLPIMTTTSIGKQSTNTILEGVALLWEHGNYALSLVVFTASVLVPFSKIGILLWLSYKVRFGDQQNLYKNTLLYRMIEMVGRWSMIDVFVVAILVALIQLGPLLSITPGTAAFPFACAVVLTMFAAMSFDSRLLWDETGGDNVN